MVYLLTRGQCCGSIGLVHTVLRCTHVAAVELSNLRSGAKSIDRGRHTYTRVPLNQSVIPFVCLHTPLQPLFRNSYFPDALTRRLGDMEAGNLAENRIRVLTSVSL